MTYEAFPKCKVKGEPCFSMGFDFDLTTPLHAIGWALVASLLVYVVFKLLRRTDAWPAMGLGCLFWVLLWIVTFAAAAHTGTFAPIWVPILAYGMAAALVGTRSGTSTHGKATDEEP
ncbi:hypothetical protein [Lentzea sp. NPDC004782]|uniref:hypothetical protein n=1 Tax=Lentzea sp. NPDC004782 TaxID=3154458 RepID=UPI0033A62DA4